MSEYTSRNKTIAKNTIYLYLRMIVSLVISLYTSRAFLDALGVEDYGIYNVVGGFVSLLNVITSSLTSGAQRFITFELGAGNVEKLNKTFATFATLFVLMAIAIFFVGCLVGSPLVSNFLVIPHERIDAAIFVFYCSLASFSINLIAVPYNACVLAHEKMNFYALISIGESFAKLLVVFALYSTSFDRLKVYALLLVVIGVIVRLSYGIYCSKNFKETKTRFLLDKSILKDILSFSMWMAFGGVVVVAKEQGVNVVINLFCGVTINAARGISVQISSVLLQFANSIASAITPQITKSYAEGDINRSTYLTFLLTKAQGIMLLLIMLPLYFELDFVLSLWLKDVPYYTNIFGRWVIITTFLTTMRNTYGPLYMATGDVKTLQWSTSLIYAMILPLSYIALKLGYKPVATMQVTAIVEIVTWFASYYYMKWKLHFPLLQYIIKVILPIGIVLSITTLIIYIMHSYLVEPNFLRLLSTCVISSIITIGTSYAFLLSNHERYIVHEYITKKCKMKL